MILINTTIYLTFIILFIISIIGHGFIFKRFFINYHCNIGEIGLLGFFQLYTIAVFLNFFFPIKIYFSLFLLLIGIFFCLYNLREIKKFSYIKSFKVIIILFIFLSLSVNLHDDYRLYQLPYIKIIQEFKIIFGLSNLNDFLTYQHGLYNIMSLFQLPFFENRLVFTIPLIFVFFCILSLNDFFVKKKYTNLISQIFILLIFLLFLFKFNRLKEYGTDIPLILLIFIIQVYTIELSQSFKISLFIKFIIFTIFAFFLKLYAILTFLYFLIFLNRYKKIINFFKLNLKLLIFLFIITFATFAKNIINSGCFIYPAPITCFDKKNLSWSYGKKPTEFRKDFLSAGAKGWRSYLKSTNYQNLQGPNEYLNKNKITYLYYTFLDKDYERLLTPIIILIVFLCFNFLKKNKLNNKFKFKNKFKLFFISFLTFLFWLMMFPVSKYGGYNYILFFFLICFYLLFKNLFYLNHKRINILLVIGLIFFLSKNTKRIYDEIYPSKKNKEDINFINKDFPIPIYRTINSTRSNNNEINVNWSDDYFECSNTKQLCVPVFAKRILNIKLFNGYVFLNASEEDVINNQIRWLKNTHFLIDINDIK